MEKKLVKRDLEERILKWLPDREIIAIRGPRQSGKTTMLGIIKDNLVSSGVDEDNIHYITFEDISLRMDFSENPKKFIDFYNKPDKKTYFLFDEVQYIDDCGQKLKLIFDTAENIKIIITGSSSFDLTELGKYLVGRVIFFNLYPFNFHEFLRTKDPKLERLHGKIMTGFRPGAKKTVFLEKLNEMLTEYLRFGSYPRVVLERSKQKKKVLIDAIFKTYIEKDIIGLYGIKYRDNVVKLLRSISSMQGNVIKYETLSEHSGLKYHKVRELMPLLQDSFVVSIVKPFYRNLLTELRKNPKIYFQDYGIKNYLSGSIDNPSFPDLYEAFFFNQTKERFNVNYWRTTSKTEVDFIITEKDQPIPVEIKTSGKISRSFQSFINQYKPKKGFVFNLDSTSTKTINGCKITTLPLVYL